MQVGVLYCAGDCQRLRKYCHDITASGLTPLQDFFMCEKPHHYALFFASAKPGIGAEAVRLCESICIKTGARCGLGRQYDNAMELNVSYRQAYFACELIAGTEKQVTAFDDINGRLHIPIGREETVRKMLGCIQRGDTAGIDDLIMQVFKSLLLGAPEEPAAVANSLGVAKAYFSSFIETLLPERKSNLNLSQVFSARNIYELFSIVKKTLHQSCGYYTQEKSMHKVNLVEQVKAFIHENYMKPVSLDQAAGVVYITSSYLSRLFSEVEGCGFANYVARVRINEAKKLLQSRRYKIYEIADIVGYKSFKHFLKVFKELEGITPAQYRENSLFFGNTNDLQKNAPE
jgi:AraC-like DNA-binding protein